MTLHVKKIKLGHSLSIYKIKLKWIKDLNVRLNSIKLEKNIGRALSDINCSNIFFSLSPRIMEIKTKINKLDLLKLKSSCTAKKTINKTKRQPTDWEKIFANDVTKMQIKTTIKYYLIPARIVVVVQLLSHI